MNTDIFLSYGHCRIFQISWHIDYSTLTAPPFRIWNVSAGIPSPPLTLFMVKPIWLHTPECLALGEWPQHHGYLAHWFFFFFFFCVFLLHLLNLFCFCCFCCFCPSFCLSLHESFPCQLQFCFRYHIFSILLFHFISLHFHLRRCSSPFCYFLQISLTKYKQTNFNNI